MIAVSHEDAMDPPAVDDDGVTAGRGVSYATREDSVEACMSVASLYTTCWGTGLLASVVSAGWV